MRYKWLCNLIGSLLLLHKELLGKIHEYNKTLHFNSKSSQHDLIGERNNLFYKKERNHNTKDYFENYAILKELDGIHYVEQNKPVSKRWILHIFSHM